MQTVKVYGVQDRRSTVQAKLPWVVRFTIDGRHRSKSFRTRIEADRYRGLLLQAMQEGRRFDETTGEPESWQTPLADVRVHEWSRRWLAEQWQEWQPRTRASATGARRKVARTRRSVDVRALPGPAAMAEAIDAIVTQQPGSKTYRVMTAVAYYAGLTPIGSRHAPRPLRRTAHRRVGTARGH